jgi:polyhydroxybutyrate depolymerase
MKLFRVACLVGILGSALGFAESAHAQQLVCQTAPGGAGMLRAGDFSNCRLTIGGQQRTFDIHVPASYTGTRNVALVLDMHGFTQNKTQQAARSQFRGLSDQVGYVYVAAQGIGNAWSAMGPCCGTNNGTTRANELAFLRGIVGAVQRNGRIDANQVFATGFSNGGSMAHTLACRASDIFSGIATVSFQLSGQNRNQANIVNNCNGTMVAPLPVISFHGNSDDTSPYNGGGFLGLFNQLISAPNSNRAWAQIQGCNLNSVTNRRINNVTTCDRFTGCDGGTAVELCTIQNGEHGAIYTGVPTLAREAWDFWQQNAAQ